MIHKWTFDKVSNLQDASIYEGLEDKILEKRIHRAAAFDKHIGKDVKLRSEAFGKVGKKMAAERNIGFYYGEQVRLTFKLI